TAGRRASPRHQADGLGRRAVLLALPVALAISRAWSCATWGAGGEEVPAPRGCIGRRRLAQPQARRESDPILEVRRSLGAARALTRRQLLTSWSARRRDADPRRAVVGRVEHRCLRCEIPAHPGIRGTAFGAR